MGAECHRRESLPRRSGGVTGNRALQSPPERARKPAEPLQIPQAVRRQPFKAEYRVKNARHGVASSVSWRRSLQNATIRPRNHGLIQSRCPHPLGRSQAIETGRAQPREAPRLTSASVRPLGACPIPLRAESLTLDCPFRPTVMRRRRGVGSACERPPAAALRSPTRARSDNDRPGRCG